ncbi:MAG: hypothetical protein EA383_12735 [Spirochaetaceae bacterium]|nr:MAG: hypothetical protein EA383_12735 [Spirochaetaceae bacterium]
MRIVIVLSLFLISIVPGQAEESSPIPERLAIGVRAGEVRISWQVPDEYDRRFFLFMHNEPIDTETVSEAQLIAVLPAGSEQYTEQISQAGDYHFAVVTERESREPSTDIIPGRNATQRAITVSFDDPLPPTPVGEILSLRTITQAGQARISIRTSSEDMRLTIIRTLAPPAAGPVHRHSYHVVGVVEGNSLQVTDDLVPGISVYYTAIESEVFDSGDIPALRPGLNTSRTAVQIAGTRTPRIVDLTGPGASDARRQTLPDVRIENTLLSGVRLAPPALERAQRAVLDEQTQRAVTRTLTRIESEPTRPAPILDARPDEGEIDELHDSYLRQILWLWIHEGGNLQANSNLRHFIASNTDPESSSKARFYLGRNEYELGNYREALYQFLLAEDNLIPQTRIWIRATLDARRLSQ